MCLKQSTQCSHFHYHKHIFIARINNKCVLNTGCAGLDPGDRQVLERKYIGCDPPCLLDSSDGRWGKRGKYFNLLRCSDLCWKVLPTTPWMWWTVSWSEGGTKCRGLLSRGLCLTFIIRMISKWYLS